MKWRVIHAKQGINKASCDRHVQSEKHQKKGKLSTVSEPPKSLEMLDIQKQLEASKRKHMIYKDESNLGTYRLHP